MDHGHAALPKKESAESAVVPTAWPTSASGVTALAELGEFVPIVGRGEKEEEEEKKKKK